MKKTPPILFLTASLIFFSCAKRNFYEDLDDPGLSRLTNNGFNIATMYINDRPYINPYRNVIRGNYLPVLEKLRTQSNVDTLMLRWPIEPNDGAADTQDYPYRNVSLELPVSKDFSHDSLFTLSGKRLVMRGNVLALNPFDSNPLRGNTNIYFVSVQRDNSNSQSPQIKLSGLFESNIGDSVLIIKGRFDFKLDISSLNF